MEIFMQSAVLKILKIQEIPALNKSADPKFPDDDDGDEPTCASCFFWDQDEENSGTCHARPPTVVALLNSEGNLAPVTVFPATSDDEWCGEHQVE
jgi:hypothetical protein